MILIIKGMGLGELALGNGLTEHWVYDTNRLQPTSMTAGSLLTLGFGYGTTNNNGNVLQQTITAPGMSTLTQVYRYL
jgi:hypothetical protein